MRSLWKTKLTAVRRWVPHPDYREKVVHRLIEPKSLLIYCLSQGGYTAETVDIYGIEDGQEKIIIPAVRIRVLASPIPPLLPMHSRLPLVFIQLTRLVTN